MIVLRNKYFSEKREDKNKKPKLSRDDKIALGIAAAGSGLAGYGYGYATHQKNKTIKKASDILHNIAKDNCSVRGIPTKTKAEALKRARKEWIDQASLYNLPNDLKLKKDVAKWGLEYDPNNKDFQKDFIFADGALKNKLGKNIGRAGLGIAGATALGYGGYKLYKNRKNKKKDDNTKN